MADFKVRINTEEDRKKVISHLKSLGYAYPSPVPIKIWGIVVVDDVISDICMESTFREEELTEMSVEEVLMLKD